MTAGAWRHSAGMIRANIWSYGSSVAFYIGFFTLALAPGLINRAIFDALSGHARAGVNVWTLIGLVIGVEFGRFGLQYFGGVLFNVFYYSSEALLKRNMMSWLVGGPGPRVMPGSPGEAVSRFRDDTLETVGFSTVMIVSPQVLTGAVAFAIMLSINAQITVVIVAPMMATVALTYLVSRRIQGYRKIAREATAAVTSFIGETFGAVQSIKLAAAEARVAQHLKVLNEHRRRASIRDLMFSSVLTFLNTNIASVASGCVLLLAAQAMRRGTFTVGDFTLFASYLAMVSAAPLLVGQILALERQSGVSIERMRSLMDGSAPLSLVAGAPPAPASPRAVAPLRTLKVRGLSCRHPGVGRGVENIDLDLDCGRFVVITGRVGAGKTTLLRALLGLIPRDGGAILWNGETVDDPATFMVPPRCAYTPQTPRLFSESLKDNILMGATVSDDLLAGAVSLAVFGQDVAGFDSGLETLVGTRGVTLSGGQLQRAAAARMFVRHAELLVFDDISSALDTPTEQELWRGLFKDGRRACLAVSHRRAAFLLADEIVLLDEGRIKARGDAATLRAQNPLFQGIWNDHE